MISACQKENKKILVQNNQIIETKSKDNEKLITKSLQTYKVDKKEITSINENVAINSKNDNVVFEFKRMSKSSKLKLFRSVDIWYGPYVYSAFVF